MVTKVRPAVVPEREVRALAGAALATADHAAAHGRCAICIASKAVAGDIDPLCRSLACSERFYALPRRQRDSLRWTAEQQERSVVG